MRQQNSVDALTPHIVLRPAGQVVVGVVRPKDDVVVEVELRDVGITCGFETGLVKAVQASEVWLPRLPGIDLIPKVVEDLGRTVPRGIGCERRSFRWWLVEELAHIRSLRTLGARTCLGPARPRLPPGASRTSDRDSKALATLN